MHMQERTWPWILLLTALTSAVADGRYTYDDIQRIVVNHAMQFWDFPRARGYYQYGVLIPLPADKRSRLLLHPYPKIQNHYNERLYHRNYKDMLVGTNFAVARPSNGGNYHTEAQLLDYLSTHYLLLEGKSAVLLYTRGTPCGSCTDDILRFWDRYRRRYEISQFIVAYTYNLKLGYMDPKSNCENRRRMRDQGVDVFCVREEYAPNVGLHQCLENDNIPCQMHNTFWQ